MTDRTWFSWYTIQKLSSKQRDLYVPNDNGNGMPLICSQTNQFPVIVMTHERHGISTIPATQLSVQQLVQDNKTILEIMRAVYRWPFDYIKGPLVRRTIPFQNIIMLQWNLVTDTDNEAKYMIMKLGQMPNGNSIFWSGIRLHTYNPGPLFTKR